MGKFKNEQKLVCNVTKIVCTEDGCHKADLIYLLVAKKMYNAKNELEFIWFAYVKVMMSYSFRLQCILCFLLPYENEN